MHPAGSYGSTSHVQSLYLSAHTVLHAPSQNVAATQMAIADGKIYIMRIIVPCGYAINLTFTARLGAPGLRPILPTHTKVPYRQGVNRL